MSDKHINRILLLSEKKTVSCSTMQLLKNLISLCLQHLCYSITFVGSHPERRTLMSKTFFQTQQKPKFASWLGPDFIWAVLTAAGDTRHPGAVPLSRKTCCSWWPECCPSRTARVCSDICTALSAQGPFFEELHLLQTSPVEGVTGNELTCHDEEQSGFTTSLKMFQCLEVTLFMRGNLGLQNDTLLRA